MDPAAIALDGLSLVFDRQDPDPDQEIPLGAWVAEFGLPFGDGPWIQYAIEQQSTAQFFPSPRAYISNPMMLAGSSTHIDMGMPLSVPAIWTPAMGIQVLLDGAPGQAWCVSPDGTLVGGGNGDAGTAFVWDARHGFQNLMVYAQQMDYLLGTDLYDQFMEAGLPSNVLGIALGNKRLVGSVGSSAFGNPCRAFVLDLP